MKTAGEATGPVAGQPPLTGARAGAPRAPEPTQREPITTPRAPLGAPRRSFSGTAPAVGRADPRRVELHPDEDRPDDRWVADHGASLRRISELRGGRRGSRNGGWRPHLPHLPIRRVGWLVLAAVLVALGWLGFHLMSGGPSVDGLRSGEVASPTALAQRDITVSGVHDVSSVDVRLDGHEVAGVTPVGSQLRFRLPVLVDGTYVLTVTSDRRPVGRVTTTRHFVVDGTPPAVRFSAPAAPVPIDEPLTLEGSVDGATDVEATGGKATMDGSQVTLRFAVPPAAPIVITATDKAGNKVAMSVAVPIAYPKTNGVHVTAKAWADPQLKAGILRMINEHRINTVELDLKDEEGVVGYDSQVKLANEIGAVQPSYTLKAALDELHGLGVRVIGRIVAFRDPILTKAAWAAGNTDWVLQTPDGQPLGAYGGFTNYVRPEVRAYNLAIAQEAAMAGVDDIMWDYVRRPEGDPSTMVVPGLTGRSSDEIGAFLAEGHALLRPLGVYQGAAVFGISATRPQTIAQDIPLIAQYVDYLAPMLYPEKWGRGEHDVADPQAQPYDIVFRSLVDFQIQVEPMHRAVMPWLQDYTGRVAYGPAEVQAQMQAAADRGITSWMFWSPHTQYSVDGYAPLS